MSPEKSPGQNEPFKKSDELSDILTFGKTGETVHRPDGKFISRSERENIEAHAGQIRDGLNELNNGGDNSNQSILDNAEHVQNKIENEENVEDYQSMSLMRLSIEARRANEANNSELVKQIRDIYEHQLMEKATDPNNGESWTQEQFDEQMADFDKIVSAESASVAPKEESVKTPESSDESQPGNADQVAESSDTDKKETDSSSDTPEKSVHSRIEEIKNSNMSDEAKKAIIDIIMDTEEYENEQKAEFDKAHELAIEINESINELDLIQSERESLAELKDGDGELVTNIKELAERIGLNLNEELESMSNKRSELEIKYKELDERELAVRARLEELGYKLPEVEGGEGLSRKLFAKMKNSMSRLWLRGASVVIPAASNFEPSKLMIPKRLEGETDQDYEKREKRRKVLFLLGTGAVAAVGIYMISRGINNSLGGSAGEASANAASDPSILNDSSMVDNSTFDSVNHIGGVDTPSTPDPGELGTLPVVEGGSDSGSTSEVTSQFSPEARTVVRGEGWYNTFKEMNIPSTEHQSLLNEIGPQLQNEGWAYFDNGWKISRPGQLPDNILEIINNSRG